MTSSASSKPEDWMDFKQIGLRSEKTPSTEKNKSFINEKPLLYSNYKVVKMGFKSNLTIGVLTSVLALGNPVFAEDTISQVPKKQEQSNYDNFSESIRDIVYRNYDNKRKTKKSKNVKSITKDILAVAKANGMTASTIDELNLTYLEDQGKHLAVDWFPDGSYTNVRLADLVEKREETIKIEDKEKKYTAFVLEGGDVKGYLDYIDPKATGLWIWNSRDEVYIRKEGYKANARYIYRCMIHPENGKDDARSNILANLARTEFRKIYKECCRKERNIFGVMDDFKKKVIDIKINDSISHEEHHMLLEDTKFHTDEAAVDLLRLRYTKNPYILLSSHVYSMEMEDTKPGLSSDSRRLLNYIIDYIKEEKEKGNLKDISVKGNNIYGKLQDIYKLEKEVINEAAKIIVEKIYPSISEKSLEKRYLEKTR
ncbi:hypothetical protein GF361_05365 [Candidatus Woesearchaeota archaeon]|nr:hypothetical protein [Candidatus Woesearchaeota archaeon]